MTYIEMWQGANVEGPDEKWERLRQDIRSELGNSNNPNAVGINEAELTMEDLVVWEKYKTYQNTETGLTREEFDHYSLDVYQKQNKASSGLRAYLVDQLTSLFYPEYKKQK